MEHYSKWIRILALLLCFFLALLALQFGVRALEKAAYPRRYEPLVQTWAKEYGVEENYVYAIIRTESGFRVKAASSVDARGLMQITEETFAWIKSKIASEEDITFEDLYTPEVNIRFGTYLLSVCMERYNQDFSTAAAAYHSGIGLVDGLLTDTAYSADGRTLKEFPYAQMRNYVHKVNAAYARYGQLYSEEA